MGETINDPDGRGKRGPMDSHPRTTRRLIEAGRGGTSPPSRNVPAELWVIVDVGPTMCFCVSACNRPEYILRGSTSSCRSSSPCQCLCSPAHPSWTPKTDLRSIPNDRKTYACQMKANKKCDMRPAVTMVCLSRPTGFVFLLHGDADEPGIPSADIAPKPMQ